MAGRGPVLAFTRRDKQETVLCAFNNSEEPQRLELGAIGALEPLLGRAHVDVGEGGTVMTVPPQSGAAFRVW